MEKETGAMTQETFLSYPHRSLLRTHESGLNIEIITSHRRDFASAQEFCWSYTLQLSVFPQSSGHNLSTRNSLVIPSNPCHLSTQLAYTAIYPSWSCFCKDSKVKYLHQISVRNPELSSLTANKGVPFSSLFHSHQINKNPHVSSRVQHWILRPVWLCPELEELQGWRQGKCQH